MFLSLTFFSNPLDTCESSYCCKLYFSSFNFRFSYCTFIMMFETSFLKPRRPWSPVDNVRFNVFYVSNIDLVIGDFEASETIIYEMLLMPFFISLSKWVWVELLSIAILLRSLLRFKLVDLVFCVDSIAWLSLKKLSSSYSISF